MPQLRNGSCMIRVAYHGNRHWELRHSGRHARSLGEPVLNSMADAVLDPTAALLGSAIDTKLDASADTLPSSMADAKLTLGRHLAQLHG